MSIDLVTDHPRTEATGRPVAVPVPLPPALVAAVGRLASAAGVPPATVLLAAFGVLLYKHTGQDELAIGICGGRAVWFPVEPDAPFARLVGDMRRAGLGPLRQAPFGRPPGAQELAVTVRFLDAAADPQCDDVTFAHSGRHDATSSSARGADLELCAAEQRDATSPPAGVDLELRPRAGGGLELCGDAGLFEPDSLERMARHLRLVLELVTADPTLTVRAVDLLGGEERALILGGFNATARPYPREATVHGLFAERAAATPDAVAVTTGRRRLTYRQLDERSGGLAARLREAGVGPGEPVGLLVPRSPDSVVAALAVLRAGGAYLPIDQDYPAERAAYLLSDSGARVLVTGGGLTPPDGFTGRVLTVGESGAGARRAATPDTAVSCTDPAYVIYTSGTTGRPKGVLVGHRAVVRLVRNPDYATLGPDTRVLATCAPVFDVATFELWGPLLNGGSVHLVPADVILSAAALGRAVAAQGITTMWLTSPLFNHLVEQDATIFRPLRELLVGGDVLSPRHVGKVLSSCPGVRLVNGYGPTENTTFSTTHPVTAADLQRIPIGRPIANSTAYVVNRDGQLCPVGVPGELCLGGDGLADGYLGRPELTATAFVPNPHVPGRRMYRSGDVARWRPDGVLEFFGRRDHQVKVRGFRIELGEVEHTLLGHPAVREAVAVALDAPGGRRLCGYYVADGAVTGGELRAHLRRRLPEHMVPGHLVELAALPLNQSGKVDRAALPPPAVDTSDGHLAPRDGVERTLARIVERVLGLPGEPGLGVRQDLRDLGADSLSATLIAAGAEAALGAGLPVGEVLRAGTVERIAEHLRSGGSRPAVAVPAAPQLDDYPLTPQQQRLYVEQLKDATAVHYNVPVTVDLPADTDVPRLLTALARLTARHDALCTEFAFAGGEVRQRVLSSMPLPVRVADGGSAEPDVAAFVRPFDLGWGPLWRGVVHADPRRVRLLLDLHHIVTDGVSLAVLVEELGALYAGEQLPPARPSYRDYACWSAGRQRVREEHGAYWAGVFAGWTPRPDLPLDHPRPPIRPLDGGAVEFDLGGRRATALRRLARAHEVTLFAVLAAAYGVLLARLTGEPDVTVGTPVSGRTAPGLDRAVGMFANTVCLRLVARPDLAFAGFLRAVAATAQDAFAHQEYPLQDLVALTGTGGYDRMPLFDSLIALHSSRYLRTTFAGRPVPLRLEWNGQAAFDLNLQVYETAGALRASWQYASRLLRRDTVESWRDALIDVIDTVLADPDTPVGELARGPERATRAPVPDLEFDL